MSSEVIDWTVCQVETCHHQISDHRFVGEGSDARLECFFCDCKAKMVPASELVDACEQCPHSHDQHRYTKRVATCAECSCVQAMTDDDVAQLNSARCGYCPHTIAEHEYVNDGGPSRLVCNHQCKERCL